MSDEQLTTSINKICDALRSTDVRQAFGDLYNVGDGSKCALGVLSCKYYKDLTKNHVNVDEYDNILKACGVPSEYLRQFLPTELLPRLDSLGHLSLENIIVRLNDFYELPFNIIADYLETTFIPEDKA